MNIALIGYGRIGRVIEKYAVSRGHRIALIIDKDNLDDLKQENLREIDVAIEFSVPESALSNIKACLAENVSVVSGTTGWLDDFDKAVSATKSSRTAFLYASNFSIGVNIMFYLNRKLSELMNDRPEYSPMIDEIHHVKKLDAPSGTAISLARGIIEKNSNLTGWEVQDMESELVGRERSAIIPVKSERIGDVPGTHRVSWVSDIDCLSLMHEAKGREGFALGAVLAAEFIRGKRGVFTMKEVLGF
jgi:4-hydroxy-tetrahydrodipicolinate reductase